jgi:CspA family cold shock protein
MPSLREVDGRAHFGQGRRIPASLQALQRLSQVHQRGAPRLGRDQLSRHQGIASAWRQTAQRSPQGSPALSRALTAVRARTRAFALPTEVLVPSGTVKWFNKVKGFGFIQPDDGSKDVFVHISAVERAGLGTLADGQKIQYELVRGKDGKTSADNLKPA